MKTLGQIAYEAQVGSISLADGKTPMDWPGEKFKDAWQTAASAVVERCKEAIRAHPVELGESDFEDGINEGYVRALKALRSLCQATTEQADNTGSAPLPTHQADYLRAAIRNKSYFSFYMDGRNEHGTHLLEGGATNILNTETILDVINDQHLGLAEKIFASAERLGHEAGHTVVTEWEWDKSGDYWGYGGINTALTEVFYGDTAEQKAKLSQYLLEEAGTADDASQHGKPVPDNKKENPDAL